MTQPVDNGSRIINKLLRSLIYIDFLGARHSLSMVADGLLRTSSTTRLMPRTSLMMRVSDDAGRVLLH